MALLDFIKKRQANRQQSVAQNTQELKPETAKQMYARQAEQETATRKPTDRMPPEQLARVDAIKEKLQKATQHIDGGTTPSAAPSDASGERAAERQNMTAQDKSAPALSPTSVQAGKTQQEKAPPKSPKKPERPQTLPRPRPSWER